MTATKEAKPNGKPPAGNWEPQPGVPDPRKVCSCSSKQLEKHWQHYRSPYFPPPQNPRPTEQKRQGKTQNGARPRQPPRPALHWHPRGASTSQASPTVRLPGASSSWKRNRRARARKRNESLKFGAVSPFGVTVARNPREGGSSPPRFGEVQGDAGIRGRPRSLGPSPRCCSRGRAGSPPFADAGREGGREARKEMEDALQSAHGGASASVPPGPGPRFPATPLAAPRAPRSHPPSTSVPAPRAAAWLQPCRPPPAECTPRGPPLPAPRVRPRAPSHGDRKFRAARPDRLRHGREGGLTGRGRRRRPAAPRPAPPPSPRAPHLHCRAPSSCSDSALQPRLRLPPRSLGPRCPSPAQTRRGRFCRQLPPHRPRLARAAVMSCTSLPLPSFWSSLESSAVSTPL
ncbi:basic salivary proline-rich protein 2-like [Cavia porcellus]|uniref:basic salivary proline-rich protein 2-like n=1 Tax=Cavia porcellus TaxID=10141 RepID=UPI002FDF57DE